MPESILDKVMLRKEDQERQSFHPLEVIHSLLHVLTAKEAEVIRRRFGLTEHGGETLETIGAAYSVTRERIRQIEQQAIQKMKQSSDFADAMKPVEHLVITVLQHYGGVMTKDFLFHVLLQSLEQDPVHRNAVSFIVSELMDDKIDTAPPSPRTVPSWKLKFASMETVDQVIAELERIITTAGAPLTFHELFAAMQQTPLYTEHTEKLTEDVILSCIEVSTILARNPFDDYGLAMWGSISPKRMHDRIYLVLKKEGKPMHFEEIAARIAKIFKRKAYPPTVHNELILNAEYVLVGRGIYALAEWGYKEGVVADVIIDVLKKAGRPMKRAEIVSTVLRQRVVKKNTIHLALTDKSLFQKLPEGQYTLAPGVSAEHPISNNT